MGRYRNSPRRDYQQGRIMAQIANQALTVAQLSARLHLCRDGITKHYLTPMRKAVPKQVFIEGYEVRDGRPAPKYRAGDAPDAVYVRQQPAVTRHAIVGEREKSIRAMLKAQPRTVTQLAAALGLSCGYVRGYIAAMHNARPKLAYIKGWENNVSPVYALGDRPDKERRGMTGREKWERKKAIMKRDEDARERYLRTLKKQGINKRIARLSRNPQGPFSALGL